MKSFEFGKYRRVLWLAWLGIILAVSVWVINAQRSELAGITKVFAHIDPYFLVPSLILECASMAAYAQLQRSMLKAGDVNPPFFAMGAVFLASNTITNVVPGGPAFASVYSFRRFRIFGASDGLAGWSIFASNVLAAFSLLLLAGIGLIVSEGSVSGISLVGSLTIVGLVIVVGVVLVSRAERVLRIVAALVHFLHRKFRRGGKFVSKIDQLQQEIAYIAPSSSRLMRGFGWGFANWICDASVLVFAYLATGSVVPIEGLLLAYSAGQLAANLPITPGGLGIVEGSISIALVAYGGNQEAAVAAVLLYRLFSFWIWLLPGAGCYLKLRSSNVASRVQVERRGSAKEELRNA